MIYPKSIAPLLSLLICVMIGCGGTTIEPFVPPQMANQTLVVREVGHLRPRPTDRDWTHKATQTLISEVSRSGLFKNTENQGVGDLILKSEVLSTKTKQYGQASSIALDGRGITAAIMGIVGTLLSEDKVLSQTSAAVAAGGATFAALARLVGQPRTEKTIELKTSLISSRTGRILWQGIFLGTRTTEHSERIAQAEANAVRAATAEMIPALEHYLQTQDFEQRPVVYANSPLHSSDVDINIPRTNMPNPHAVAVAIGNREYQHRDIPRVDFAGNDAAVVKEHLIRTLGYREGNILFEPNATKAVLEAIFGTDAEIRGKLYSVVSPDVSDVFVYYSGHGAPHPSSGRGYLVPVDADASLIHLNGYSLDLLYRNLAEIPARRFIIVLDSCFSGGSHRGWLLKNISSLIIPDLRIESDLLTKGVVFTPASSNQVSSWYPEQRHGLFTYFFLKGLRGEADGNQDRQITSQELENYLTNPHTGVPYHARYLYKRQQTPEMHGQSDFVLVRLSE